MTYFGILALFLLPPLAILLAWVPRDVWRWVFRREGQVNWAPYIYILVNIALALNLTVCGIVAHQSALKGGELLKIPQYRI